MALGKTLALQSKRMIRVRTGRLGGEGATS